MVVLLVVGVALVVFGALVLLLFPERPGGRLAWHGVEVSSVGAGLPLVVLGVIAIAMAASGVGGRADSTSSRPHDSAESAAGELLQAWQRGDRRTVARVADPAAVEKLSGAPALKIDPTQLTCYPVGTGQHDCQVPHARGMTISSARPASPGRGRGER